MFWRKKQIAAVPVGAGPTATAPTEVKVPVAKIEVPKAKKLPGPKELPLPVGRYIIVDLKQEPDWVWGLRSVIRPRLERKNRFDVRVFDMIEAARKKVTINDYTSLDEHPELVLFEGWFDKDYMSAEIKDKRGRA